MKSSINCFIGLQLPKNICLREVKDWLYQLNQSLKKSEIGKVFCASLHKKKNTDESKSIVIVSIDTQGIVNFDDILKNVPNLQTFKRYLITDVAIALKHTSDLNQYSYERFAQELDTSKLLYYPDNSKPACIIKAIYHHYFCIEGDVVWYNNVPISISAGKYFARQLYCELYLDAIKTNDGYKVPTDAIINVSDNEITPQFQNKQVVLSVEEIKCPNKPEDLLSNNFKIIVN